MIDFSCLKDCAVVDIQVRKGARYQDVWDVVTDLAQVIGGVGSEVYAPGESEPVNYNSLPADITEGGVLTLLDMGEGRVEYHWEPAPEDEDLSWANPFTGPATSYEVCIAPAWISVTKTYYL